MFAFCRDNGFYQHVRKPTCGKNVLDEGHLLDLVLSDFHSSVRIQIDPETNTHDHNVVLATFQLELPSSAPPVQREVWDFSKADGKRVSVVPRPLLRAEDTQAARSKMIITLALQRVMLNG